MNEKTYILGRKAKALMNRACYWVCGIMPVKKNLISVCTYEGKGGFCCNPRYIVEELHKRNPGYEFVWFVDDMQKEFPEYIKKVPNTWWSRAYWLSRSKVWIDNYRKPYGTRKRKSQYYFNTWHGNMCIKPIGRYRGKAFPKIAQLVSEADSAMIDCMLSATGWWDKHYKDGLLYDGKVERTGLPRCDIMLNQRKEMQESLRKNLNIPEDANIIMYAPTFRGGSQSTSRSVGVGEIQIDFERLVKALESKFEGKWYVLLRLHPQLAAENNLKDMQDKYEYIRDVTHIADMNELIAGIDMFITDYSSAIFEACVLKMPCFIYADDLGEYVNERGGLFFDMYQLPFPVAVNNEELMSNISSFDEDSYQVRLAQLMKEQDIREDGKASARVADIIEQWTKTTEREM